MTPEEFAILRDDAEQCADLLDDLFNAPYETEEKAILEKWDLTLEQAQTVCGDVGHIWTTGEHYTNMGLSCWSVTYCEVCGVGKDYDDGY